MEIVFKDSLHGIRRRTVLVKEEIYGVCVDTLISKPSDMEGYGTVFIECHDGVFRVLVWGKNQEDPSHIIELPRIP